MRNLLREIIKDQKLHIRFLNTLSYLENEGAKKIAKTEHPTLVKMEMLKHAKDEFRHAHFLKMQIYKLTPNIPPTYEEKSCLGGFYSRRYLDRLELFTLRALSKEPLSPYYVVTYAIELRAKMLYPLYEELLRKEKIPIFVKSIVLEEEEHLKEMEKEISSLPTALLKAILSYEEQLFQEMIWNMRSEL